MAEITWHNTSVTLDERRKLLGQKPLVIWFTGLSGSGKSSVAADTERKLIANGYTAYLLDGDNVRRGLNSNLGFAEADRTENVRRLAETAKLMADSGLIVLVSAISPMYKMRTDARESIEQTCEFVEVYMAADVMACAARDPKGLYKRAMNGEIKDFTGVSAPYEIPENPEIILDTVTKTIDYDSDLVYNYIMERQIDYARLCAIVPTIAVKAGEAIMEIYNSGNSDVEYKADTSPLTEADKSSNTIICSELEKYFPFYPILTEEKADTDIIGRTHKRYCFIVDPLDGTKEFIKRNGEFTVNIALTFDGEPIFGVIHVPCTKTTYFAYKNGGAYKTSGDGSSDRINASSRRNGLTVVASRSHGDDRLEKLLAKNKDMIANTVSIGSSLKGCLIAEGVADIYYRFGYTMEWDTAAMHVICVEAGAFIRQLDDTPLLYNRRNTLNEKGFYILNNAENKLQ
jgi:3'(2'), 5'-bisphosphate nucleotidase